MECEICGQSVESSEDLQKHKDREHPAGVGAKSMDDLEQPDLLGATPEESTAAEVAQPTH